MKDIIYREDAIKAFNTKHFVVGDAEAAINIYSYMCDVMRRLKNLPSAQPETCAYWDRESNFCALHRPSAQPKKMKATLINPNPYGLCSECNYLIDMRDEFNYCPNCGADMRGD